MLTTRYPDCPPSGTSGAEGLALDSSGRWAARSEGGAPGPALSQAGAAHHSCSEPGGTAGVTWQNRKTVKGTSAFAP